MDGGDVNEVSFQNTRNAYGDTLPTAAFVLYIQTN